MPTYDYRCEACGHEFEHFQAISDPLLRKCPRCKKPKLKRLIGAGAGLLFKGSGFYITDYRNPGYHEAAKKDAPADAKSGESAAKSDGATKPADSTSKTSRTNAPSKGGSGGSSAPSGAPSGGGEASAKSSSGGKSTKGSGSKRRG